jgi:hypothetical protein
MQESSMQTRILNDENFKLERQVKLESIKDNRVVLVGEGTLTLTKKEYTFDGTIDGEKKVHIFDVKNVSTLPSDIGINVQIYEGNQLFQFVFDDPKCPTMFVHAGEFMHKIIKSL